MSPDYQIAAVGDVYSLHIPEVFDEDAGRFSVTAENDSGKATCSALLVIADEAQLVPSEGSPPPTPLAGMSHDTLAPRQAVPPLKQPPPIRHVQPPQPVAAPPPPKPAPVLPKFTHPLRNATAEEGGRVVLEASVVGGPETSVKWYKDGKEILPGTDFDMQFKNNKATLTIPEVFVEDAGKYTCAVTNPAGTVDTSAELIVKG